ncbi:MAG TPA: hypothetical protein VII11_09395 [Bacteroidota bacterium]
MHHLILIHGMGNLSPEEEFYQPFERALEKAFSTRGEDVRRHVVFHRVDYTHVAEDAKAEVLNRSFPEYGSQPPTGLNLIHFLRHFITVFVGDVVVYASAEGENTIRKHVFGALDTVIQKDAAEFSIVAHSLGSIIAYDYLYNVFGKEPSKRRRVRGDGKQKLRHFFTFGSPIGLFLLRKLGVVGAETALLPNPVGLDAARGAWLNFYDRQDVIAYPLEGFFRGTVQDVQVQTGDLIYNSHMNYWKDKEVVERIADCLLK